MTWAFTIVLAYFMVVALIYASYMQLPIDQQPKAGPAVAAATLPLIYVAALVVFVVLAPVVFVGKLIFNRGRDVSFGRARSKGDPMSKP